ncbi:RNA exonuclease 4 [Periophthalmus magnuspinnatus]|uniref:RNA exonuclease 4 n=1 Tax=Periophthalmus magnuspinnatus TaxID=409849 RepID=UPI00145BED5D|nr:RNA exonuclease 4 [Periophthalmus magnuspinnatus]
MSAIVSTSNSHRQKPKGEKKNKTAKKKKKEYWIKCYKKKPQEKQQQKSPTASQILPPVDAQLFSANWKTLQEMLKNQPEKPQRQNGTVPNEKSTKTSTINDKGMQQKKDFVKPVKKTVKDSSAEEPNVNDAHVRKTNTPCSTTKKRKLDLKNTQDKKQEAKKLKSETKTNKPTEEDIWFDDVDPDDIEATVGAEAAEIMRKKMGIHQSKDVENALVKEKAFEGLTKAVAIDCEMVGVGPDGEESILARVSLVNQFGKCIYDKYVKPTEKVTDYRTHVSGIRPEDIKNGEDIDTVRKEVAEILQSRIVVGHAIHNDLKILLLDHPKKKIRDTQKYEPFKKMAKSRRPALRVLCKEVLNVKIQQGEHSSVHDAQATMRLYTTVKKQWEAQIKAGIKNKDSEKKRRRQPALGKTKTVRTGLPP